MSLVSKKVLEENFTQHKQTYKCPQIQCNKIALRLGHYVICGHYKRLIGCCDILVGNHSESPFSFLCGGGEGHGREGSLLLRGDLGPYMVTMVNVIHLIGHSSCV